MASKREKQGYPRENSEQAVSSKEWLIPFLLVCMGDKGSRGKELEWKIEEIGLRDVQAAEMYRTLGEMEGEGLIRTESGGDGPLWQSPVFPRRKYSISEPGRAYLEFWSDYLKLHQKPMDLFLQIYDRRSGRSETLSGERNVIGR